MKWLSPECVICSPGVDIVGIFFMLHGEKERLDDNKEFKKLNIEKYYL